MSSPTDLSPTPHLDSLRAHWAELNAYRSGARVPLIDGATFSLAGVVAVSQHGIVPRLDDSPSVLARVQASADFAAAFVANAEKGSASMYGVTTGFGGSANTRVKQAPKLQEILIRGLQAGIIPLPSTPASTVVQHPALSAESLLMPEPWTKGAIAIRLNALIRGHSGSRFAVLQALLSLLEKNITPCPPLRMSISASGDLAPLAYISGAIIGSETCFVWAGEGPNRTRIPASQALAAHSLSPLTLLPKEGLALVNGTAPSASTAALALHAAHFTLLLAQACTALSVEVLLGTREPFAAFLSDVARPHAGQVEVARNLRHALAGSHLAAATHDEADPAQRLRQDRYSVRTAPQWLGPQVEELVAAHATVGLEINATTDNPIIEVYPEGGGRGLSGGNFQGTSLTVAMEKVRIGLGHVGRMAYAQLVELGSPSMNRGLSPDLAAGEPSLDYGQKALDIAAAAYLAELSFVSNTVSNHVQPAEMHNQSVNSLALVSARYTITAVQLTQMILANQLLCLCQAADLRAMYTAFFHALPPLFHAALSAHITPRLPTEQQDALVEKLLRATRTAFGETGSLDSGERWTQVIRPLVADVFTFLSSSSSSHTHTFSATEFHTSLASTTQSLWLANRAAYFAGETPDASTLLGRTGKLYRWVRRSLGVAMWKEIVGKEGYGEEMDKSVSRVYAGIVEGEVDGVLLDVLGGGDMGANE